MGSIFSSVNKPHHISWSNFKQAEYNVYSLSGVPMEQIKRKSIKVGEFNGEPVYIRTIICSDEQTNV